MEPDKRPSPLLLVVCLAIFLATSSAQANIDILFNYSYDSNNFFNNTNKGVLESAASYFESILTDDLTAITSGGDNHFNASFSDPSTGDSVTINDYSVAADTIEIFVGARDLGTTTLGEGGPGGYSVSGTSNFVTNAITRGETSTTAGVNGSSATDFAPWGGSIAFDIDANWYYDTDTGTDESFSGYDFYSVALHELGHVLGIGTADSWSNKISNGAFAGPHAVAAHGGAVPVTSDGGHWKDGTTSTVNGQSQEAAMDPTIAAGQRKRFTKLDEAGLEDIGWQVSSASPQ